MGPLTPEASGDRARVDVVVVTWNSADVLPGLLDSLEAGMRGVDWDLIVVDNASSDSTIEVATALGREVATEARVVGLASNEGFAVAVNRGLADSEASSDVLVLNPDVRLEPDCAARMRARLHGDVTDGAIPAGLRVGIVAPRVHDAARRLSPTLRFEPSVARALAETAIGVRASGRLGWGETVLDPAAYARPFVADWISGAVLMISRECLTACGPLDESYFLYSEDTEYALRARDRGFVTQLAPDAVATHLGGSSRSDPELWARLVLNKLTLSERRHGRARGLVFWIASLLRELRFAATGNGPSRRAVSALVRSRRSAG